MNYCFDFLEDIEKEVDDLRNWFAGYLHFALHEFDLAQRLKEDKLVESDLFLLRGFCSRAPGINEKEFIFRGIIAED